MKTQQGRREAFAMNLTLSVSTLQNWHYLCYGGWELSDIIILQASIAILIFLYMIGLIDGPI